MMQDPSFGASQMEYASSLAPGVEHEDRRRKNSAATATNDKELRELLARNESRLLKEVAHEVIQKERTPQAEKPKQLFAMLWFVDIGCHSKSIETDVAQASQGLQTGKNVGTTQPRLFTLCDTVRNRARRALEPGFLWQARPRHLPGHPDPQTRRAWRVQVPLRRSCAGR